MMATLILNFDMTPSHYLLARGVQSFWPEAPTRFILPMALARIDLNQKTVLFAAPNGGAAVIPCCMPHSWPSQMTVPGVRREKAALSSGCKPHPATAPAGSNRSSHGGNEVAEEIRMPR